MRKISLIAYTIIGPVVCAGLMIGLSALLSAAFHRQIDQDRLAFGFIVAWALWQIAFIIFLIQAWALKRG